MRGWIVAVIVACAACQSRAETGERSVGVATTSADPFDVASALEQRWREQPNAEALGRALDAYTRASAGAKGCEARLRGALLSAEAGGDPALARRAVEELALRPACAPAAERALAVMGKPTGAEPAAVAPVALAAGAESSAALEVTKVDRYGAKQSARIVVFLTQRADYEVGELAATEDKGPRLFVDIAGAAYSGETQFDVGGLVERVRLGEQPTGLRVVLDLQQRVYKRVFFLPEPARLVIDVSQHPARAAAFTPGKGQRIERVVLDPGHGGFDPGATGMTGLQEKDVALDIAHRAAPLIARELGIDTLLTRDADAYVALDERVAKANAFLADLFISIHCNAAESSEPHGVMSFVLDASGDSMAQGIAARENAASHAAVEDFSASIGSMVDAATLRASMHFAGLLQRATVASLSEEYVGIHDGGVRKAGFFVLAGARMPAVLFEASFISNPTEEGRLDSARYRQKIADGLVNAVRAYATGL